MTDEQAYEVVATLQAAFPTRRLQEPTVAIYAKALEPFDYQAAMDAVARIATSRFDPWPPPLAEMLAEVIGAPTPEEAWIEVVEQCRKVGSYRSPAFSHPLIDAAVHRFGWAALCRSELDDWKRQEFTQSYEVYRGRALRDGVLPEPRPHALAEGFGQPDIDPRDDEPRQLEP